MNLSLKLLTKDEIDLFNKANDEAFNVHSRYFPDGNVHGADEDGDEELNLEKIIDEPMFTVLSIRDDDKFIGGAIVEDKKNGYGEIHIFFLTVEYQSRGIGRFALEMVENYFPDVKVFQVVTPSQVVRNVVFYVNKCEYKIVRVVGFDREKNTADYVFEKRRK